MAQSEEIKEETKSPADVIDETSQADETKMTGEVEQLSAEVEKQAALIAELQTVNETLEDKYLRSEAEMANMTTRFKKEREQLLKYEGQDLAKEILPAIDNLQRALASEIASNDAGAQQLKKGVEMVIANLESALSRFEIVKIGALGEPFDPNVHQAVQTVPASEDQAADTIVQVFQEGYMLKDRVLRPAMVVVAQ